MTITKDLTSIIQKANQRQRLSADEIKFLLSLREEGDTGRLFDAARQLRQRYFSNRVFLYGFLYISTYCRNNCDFCFYRQCNRTSPRYRKEERQILEAAVELAESGVHLIDITLGEDPYLFEGGEKGFAPLVGWVKNVQELTGLPVMVSAGVVPETVLQKLAGAGADWYACYQETHNPDLFARLRPGQDYDTRLKTKTNAHRKGLLTEEGILVGVGESPDDIAFSAASMGELDADQVRAMNFVPQEGTPMANFSSAHPLLELLCIAIFRLLYPDRLIPATLDVDGLSGLKKRLEAGANVVTSLVPPQQGLAGVARSSLDIDEARRTVSGVKPVLETCGLEIAPLDDYTSWIKKRRSEIDGVEIDVGVEFGRVEEP